MESIPAIDDEQSTVNDRLNTLVDYFERGKKASFARKVDISPQAAQEILSGRRSEPSFKVLVRILRGYPQVRTDWLILGNGPMLHDEGITPGRAPIYATAEQYEKAHLAANEKKQMFFEQMDAIKPELTAQIRRTMATERANANAVQEALMIVYAVGDSNSTASRLSTRLALTEEQALQLVKNGKIRGTNVYDYSNSQNDEPPVIMGYRVSELAVREFLGEPTKYESRWSISA